MSKLREALEEAKVKQLDRQNANMTVSVFLNRLKLMATETKKLRKLFGPLYGKELKKAEADINKIVSSLDNELSRQILKTEP
jgi:hypothetical protein